MTPLRASLASLAKDRADRESQAWGTNAIKDYFEPADLALDSQWDNIISPVLTRYPINYSHTLDFACGHGRHTTKLSDLSDHVTLVDANESNIRVCRTRFSGAKYQFIHNSGYELSNISDGSISFVYSFDAVVHFDLYIVISYLTEFRRIMMPGAFGFIHHSNFSAAPGRKYVDNPHARNFMSNGLFAHLCVQNGFSVLQQEVISWGGILGLDCLTVFQSPNLAEMDHDGNTVC